MPCLSWRALESLASSAAISSSMSERMVAMALCSTKFSGYQTSTFITSGGLILWWLPVVPEVNNLICSQNLGERHRKYRNMREMRSLGVSTKNSVEATALEPTYIGAHTLEIRGLSLDTRTADSGTLNLLLPISSPNSITGRRPPSNAGKLKCINSVSPDKAGTTFLR